MALKNKIIENIVAPVASSHSASLLEGTIIDADEKSNTCTIEYINSDGYKMKEEGIPIQLQNVGIIDWFPKERDKVLISAKGSSIFVTGPNYGSSYNNVRNKIELVEDIYCDDSSYFMGGFIF